jgi:hypothetical protein
MGAGFAARRRRSGPGDRWSPGSGWGWPLWAVRRTSPAAVRRTCPTAAWPACGPGPSRCWTLPMRPGSGTWTRPVPMAWPRSSWLAERGHADVTAGSKWGYRYTGGWRLDAPAQEVKEHSLAMLTTQLAQSRALLGDRLTLRPSAPRTPGKTPVTRATATWSRHPEMAGQTGNPGGSGLHNRSHRPPSVAFSVPVRGLVRGRPWAGPWPVHPRSVDRADPETRRARTHSGRRRPEIAPRTASALVSGG